MHQVIISFYRVFLLAVLILPISVTAQMTKQDSIWLPLKSFVGTWVGKGSGEPGIGEYERTYQFVLNKKFIQIKNKSSYPPTVKNPKGEVHEDIGYFSYDKIRRKYILRQFHVEGFVNQFTLDSISTDGNTIIFVSESIENIPSGWRAREIYQLQNENQIHETFELAAPNKDYEVYSKVTLKKVNLE